MAKEDIERISHTFDNGVTVVNTTPHPLNFQDSVSGETIVIPTSVPEGERTGDFVVNAGSNEVDLGGGLVTTEFVPSEEGMDRIQEIKEWASEEGKDVRIVGSMIAAQAYPMDVVGMVAAPGFERVPPQDKLMSVEKFTAFQGEINNDVTDDKAKELENKIEATENEPLDENTVGDSSEEMEEKTISDTDSSSLAMTLEEEGYEVVSAWETAEIMTENGDHVIIEEQVDSTYNVVMLAENGEPRIDDEGNEMIENVSDIDEIADTIKDFEDRISDDDNDSVVDD